MYVPKQFQQPDPALIRRVIAENGFATLVSNHQGQLMASHIPMQLVDDAAGGQWLHGHLARGNKQWLGFKQPAEVLAIFQGPHAYVSSTWYNHANVPTWNYVAVHVTGTARLVEERAEQDAMLRELAAQYEAGDKPFTLESLTPEHYESELKGIVCLKVQVHSMQAAFKLSQNRDAEDFENVTQRLASQGDTQAGAVADWMRRLCPHKK